MFTRRSPGVYKEEVFLEPPGGLRTGVPAFLGFAETGPINQPQPLTQWPEFGATFGKPLANGYLAHAVRGFFDNGGRLCYVVRRADSGAAADAGELDRGLRTLALLNMIDVVCAPDLTRDLNRLWQTGGPAPDPEELRALQETVVRAQSAILTHSDTLGDRFAILDALPRASVNDVLQQRARLSGNNGALYYPWIKVEAAAAVGGFVPPCGHVAGVYARSDQQVGVHKAPANAVLEGVLDLEVNVALQEQDLLNPEGVNCLRAFPGRGIRVWGARTLNDDPAWLYVNVRRLFLTAGRWIERNMADVVFEPNDLSLWARIGRELNAYFGDLYQRGALRGRTAQEAFYVKCDAETNPPEVRALGQVVTEIGLAPTLPNEFVVIRIIYGPTGIHIAGPRRST